MAGIYQNNDEAKAAARRRKIRREKQKFMKRLEERRLERIASIKVKALAGVAFLSWLFVFKQMIR